MRGDRSKKKASQASQSQASQSSNHKNKQDTEMLSDSESIPEEISDALRDLITETVQKEIQSLTTNLEMTTDHNKNLLSQIDTLEKRLKLTEGLLSQAHIKISQQNEKIIDLQTCSMWNNIVIRGIEEAQNESWEDTEKKVVQFMKDQLKIDDANEAMLDRAHRIGKKIPEKHRNIVVKFASSHDKSQIFKNIKNLAEKKQYSIQEQYPQEVQERRKRLWPLFKEAKERAKHDRTHKVSWSVDKLNINGRLYTAKDDIQCISPSEQCEQNVHIEHSQKQSEVGSVFQGQWAMPPPYHKTFLLPQF